MFNSSKFLSWIFLLLAIAFEVLGTSFLKLENVSLALFLMAVFIAISYFFMGLCLKHIQVGIAYALWELLGTLGIVCIALFVFKESLSFTQICGIVLAFIGIILINFGEVKP
ncbi:QacE family quaternary ammonium compound efflux SMR transporter [Campylobacter sp. MIT 12-8780]|uniref:DMT family transporter n=1 Tax=unclassified Campylobacter TaxID=2593542 RepID=UPI00115D8855|nr:MULTISPECIES: multidrug efflux SMR transporter [unclassified Campylobacter]NDJ27639.1 EamA family transporter [Campylobacter sp. MIT 19-121]TQR40883.1 QacE family quaternary ammonium compound efflux SMR transporter [Campylobacter sp. MIT 12-8780]